MLLAKSQTGEELARQLISAISTELFIPTNPVVAFMQDRTAVNCVAMRTVSVLYSQMLDCCVLLTHVRSGWRPYQYTSVDRVHQIVGELTLTQLQN